MALVNTSSSTLGQIPLTATSNLLDTNGTTTALAATAATQVVTASNITHATTTSTRINAAVLQTTDGELTAGAITTTTGGTSTSRQTTGALTTSTGTNSLAPHTSATVTSQTGIVLATGTTSALSSFTRPTTTSVSDASLLPGVIISSSTTVSVSLQSTSSASLVNVIHSTTTQPLSASTIVNLGHSSSSAILPTTSMMDFTSAATSISAGTSSKTTSASTTISTSSSSSIADFFQDQTSSTIIFPPTSSSDPSALQTTSTDTAVTTPSSTVAPTSGTTYVSGTVTLSGSEAVVAASLAALSGANGGSQTVSSGGSKLGWMAIAGIIASSLVGLGIAIAIWIKCRKQSLRNFREKEADDEDDADVEKQWDDVDLQDEHSGRGDPPEHSGFDFVDDPQSRLGSWRQRYCDPFADPQATREQYGATWYEDPFRRDEEDYGVGNQQYGHENPLNDAYVLEEDERLAEVLEDDIKTGYPGGLRQYNDDSALDTLPEGDRGMEQPALPETPINPFVPAISPPISHAQYGSPPGSRRISDIRYNSDAGDLRERDARPETAYTATTQTESVNYNDIYGAYDSSRPATHHDPSLETALRPETAMTPATSTLLPWLKMQDASPPSAPKTRQAQGSHTQSNRLSKRADRLKEDLRRKGEQEIDGLEKHGGYEGGDFHLGLPPDEHHPSHLQMGGGGRSGTVRAPPRAMMAQTPMPRGGGGFEGVIPQFR